MFLMPALINKTLSVHPGIPLGPCPYPRLAGTFGMTGCEVPTVVGWSRQNPEHTALQERERSGLNSDSSCRVSTAGEKANSATREDSISP